MTTLLIVDDEAVIASVLAAALSDEGYDTVTAGHGAEALERLAENPQAMLVLSDFMMPVLDGSGLLRAMRDCPVHARTRFILMSSLPEAHVRGKAQGYEAFLRKPFILDDVLALVARVLDQAPRSIN